MKIQSIQTPDPVCVTPSTSLDEAFDLMHDEGIRHLPVVEGGALVGILSDRDLLLATGGLPERIRRAHRSLGGEETPRAVADAMHADPVTVSPDDSVVAATVEFLFRGIGCLPVTREGRLVGIVTTHDLLRAYERVAPAEAEPVRGFMSSRVVTIEPEDDIESARELCLSSGFRHLVVAQAGRLVGIVSDRDLRRARGAGRDGSCPVDTVMTKEVESVGPDTPLRDAIRTMCERGIDCLPVIDDELVAGLLTTTDLLDHFLATLRTPDPPE